MRCEEGGWRRLGTSSCCRIHMVSVLKEMHIGGLLGLCRNDFVGGLHFSDGVVHGRRYPESKDLLSSNN